MTSATPREVEGATVACGGYGRAYGREFTARAKALGIGKSLLYGR